MVKIDKEAQEYYAQLTAFYQATPAGAFKNGSSHIVVGRPITKAADRQKAALAIVDEIKQ